MSYGTPVDELSGVDARHFREHVLPAARPLVIRGVAASWPAVEAASAPGGVGAYLAGLDNGAPCQLLEGPPGIEGRFFYDDSFTGFNFTRMRTTLSAALARLESVAMDPSPPALAVQAIATSEAAPGFAAANPAPLIDAPQGPRLWIGNRVKVAIHHDPSRNLAVCVAGRRRFTLFPPTATCNLYIGPLEYTPAGTPISLVDATAPDLDRFPRFAEAMSEALVVELEPGDAVYIPYMWWHHVESRDPLSVLANYWWNETPPPLRGLAPQDALLHARLAFAAASPEQRAAWREMFDEIVFCADEPAHIPQARRGLRGALGAPAVAQMKRQLANLLLQ